MQKHKICSYLICSCQVFNGTDEVACLEEVVVDATICINKVPAGTNSVIESSTTATINEITIDDKVVDMPEGNSCTSRTSEDVPFPEPGILSDIADILTTLNSESQEPINTAIKSHCHGRCPRSISTHELVQAHPMPFYSCTTNNVCNETDKTDFQESAPVMMPNRLKMLLEPDLALTIVKPKMIQLSRPQKLLSMLVLLRLLHCPTIPKNNMHRLIKA